MASHYTRKALWRWVQKADLSYYTLSSAQETMCLTLTDDVCNFPMVAYASLTIEDEGE